jgi:hypothetical protein
MPPPNRSAKSPNLGGHLYNCIDKLNGRTYLPRESLHQQGEYRGPRRVVAHSRDTVSPVNFGFRQEDRAEVWVGNVGRVTGMERLAEFVFREGSAILEEHVTLRNDTEARTLTSGGPMPTWLWTRVARFVYPARVMATHGLEELQAWPREPKGSDRSNPKQPRKQQDMMGFFGYGSREPFMAIYNASRTAFAARRASTLPDHPRSAERRMAIQKDRPRRCADAGVFHSLP